MPRWDGASPNQTRLTPPFVTNDPNYQPSAWRIVADTAPAPKDHPQREQHDVAPPAAQYYLDSLGPPRRDVRDSTDCCPAPAVLGSQHRPRALR
jgi:hypothetical protein